MEQKFKTVNDFEHGKPIEIGRLGQVWLSRHKDKKYLVAFNMTRMTDIKINQMFKNP